MQIAVRVVPELAELLDRFASEATEDVRANLPGMTVGRVDAVRVLLTEALRNRGYDVRSVLSAEENAARGSVGNGSSEHRQFDLVVEAQRRELKENGVTIEADLLSGEYTQSEIARRHGCSRQHVSQVKKRLTAKGTTVPKRRRRRRTNGKG